MRLYKFYVHGIISLLLGLSRMFFETAFFMPLLERRAISFKLQGQSKLASIFGLKRAVQCFFLKNRLFYLMQSK